MTGLTDASFHGLVHDHNFFVCRAAAGLDADGDGVDVEVAIMVGNTTKAISNPS